MTEESLYPRAYVVLCLRSGQTVRLPLRRRGRGVEHPPVGPEELESWLEKRPDVLVYAGGAVDFAYVEHGDQL